MTTTNVRDLQHLSKHEERHLGGDRSTLCGIPFASLGFNFTVYDERDGFSFNEGAPAPCETCRLRAATRPWGGR